MNIYDFTVKDADQNNIDLSIYRGKVLLIVNTATGCGLTPQYKGLQHIYDQFREQGFEILDFPCNQFGHQAPGTGKEIQNFCQLNYATTFKQFAKIEVNGDHEIPLYTYLKKEKGSFMGSAIKWNFTKFLVDKDGAVVKRYKPTDKPEKIGADIAKLLKK